jgi:hypothetical protein
MQLVYVYLVWMLCVHPTDVLLGFLPTEGTFLLRAALPEVWWADHILRVQVPVLGVSLMFIPLSDCMYLLGLSGKLNLYLLILGSLNFRWESSC